MAQAKSAEESWVTSSEACRQIGCTRAMLSILVSRGTIQYRGGDHPSLLRYNRADVEQIACHPEPRKNPQPQGQTE